MVGFMNDEGSWQRAYKLFTDPANTGRNTDIVFKERFLRWRSVALFVIKAVVQWLFGFGMTASMIFSVAFLPLTVITVILLIVAITLQVMVGRRPRANGPTTYGNFALLLYYIPRYRNA
jgi:hypothetical protein